MNITHQAQAQNKEEMGIEQVTAKEACTVENEDEMLQVTKYLQSPEIEPKHNFQPQLHLSSSYL